MKISESERSAILAAIAIGEIYGFGNIIAHLNTAWAKRLIRDGVPENVALKSTHGEGYPIKMQDDLLTRREWDETGERYLKEKRKEGSK